MNTEEEREVLLVEMRLAGVPHQVVNYLRKYMGRDIDLYRAREWLTRDFAHNRDLASYWVASYGHHFEDADNLPTDEEWRARPRTR